MPKITLSDPKRLGALL